MDSHIVYYYYLITDYSHYQFNTAKMPFNGMTCIYNMNDIFVIICVTVLLSQISDVLVIILIIGIGIGHYQPLYYMYPSIKQSRIISCIHTK